MNDQTPYLYGSSVETVEGVPPGSGRRWPIAITVGLLIVVVVNFAFIWIAVGGADEVVESYVTADR